ncbi:response regulator containing a -like receiver domain protein and an hth dna-binding domain protein [Leptolyngbya sp. Heron Island J]|uniref:response regulator n=1 Tax=Leptolyngbya sp. Heron Island J TaxID=1385935 RepID=UPI0003B9B9CA|nr:response regulator transcription factor [Leptolyngbya sp. Heron Island J]ESA35204.1 response regulator containing a -like receiver domain protein and an hth dna-binding domain protein [Leptolyngbya sp. Heron Island J]
MASSQKTIRLLLADDEDIIRYGLSAILQCETAIEVVGEACNGQDAVEQAQQLKPDIVLMDIGMPLMDGVVATGRICQALPDVKVLILTTSTEDHHLHDAMQQGASGYLLKNIPPEDFIHVIQSTYKGYMQFDPVIGQKLYQQFKSPQPAKALNDWKGATPREREVLKLIAAGASNREISQTLHIAEKTVKNHVSNILSRVGLRDRTQLAIWVNTTNLDVLQTA